MLLTRRKGAGPGNRSVRDCLIEEHMTLGFQQDHHHDGSKSSFGAAPVEKHWPKVQDTIKFTIRTQLM